MNVIIIGGGIGGLALAHGLRRSGVPVEVYERDAAADSRWSGYRIHINPVGARALHACLPAPTWQEFLATSGPGGDFGFLTDQLDELLVVEESIMYPGGSAPQEGHYAADRATLRRLLTTGLDDVLHYGADYVEHERLDGRPDPGPFRRRPHRGGRRADRRRRGVLRGAPAVPARGAGPGHRGGQRRAQGLADRPGPGRVAGPADHRDERDQRRCAGHHVHLGVRTAARGVPAVPAVRGHRPPRSAPAGPAATGRRGPAGRGGRAAGALASGAAPGVGRDRTGRPQRHRLPGHRGRCRRGRRARSPCWATPST